AGSENIGIGYGSGRYKDSPSTFADLNKLTTSILIGNYTATNGDDQVNTIVIGDHAVGIGSNTVRIGNDQMTKIEGAVAWSNPSDVRLKKDIVSSTHVLGFGSKLCPFTYHMKTGTTDLQSGFIAQEVETAAKAVNYEFSGIVKPASENEFYSLRYSEFVVPLVKAVQEQQQMIESQKADIAELKAQVQALLKAA
ncbi:tail fiber domain-containing protein, partial [Flavobacterium maritimum]|uniref:tail fiber domain-containing protein n=1 Tax=Flavobacterium maritimum TaxID=3149042 RepID=UPI0032B3C103